MQDVAHRGLIQKRGGALLPQHVRKGSRRVLVGASTLSSKMQTIIRRSPEAYIAGTFFFVPTGRGAI